MQAELLEKAAAAEPRRVFAKEIPVRWAELDSNGHVNNMHYQSYFDEARISSCEEVGFSIAALREAGRGPVIQRIEFDYLHELKHPDTARILTLPDETVVIPGHGPRTTIGEEREENPFLAG